MIASVSLNEYAYNHFDSFQTANFGLIAAVFARSIVDVIKVASLWMRPLHQPLSLMVRWGSDASRVAGLLAIFELVLYLHAYQQRSGRLWFVFLKAEQDQKIEIKDSREIQRVSFSCECFFKVMLSFVEILYYFRSFLGLDLERRLWQAALACLFGRHFFGFIVKAICRSDYFVHSQPDDLENRLSISQRLTHATTMLFSILNLGFHFYRSWHLQIVVLSVLTIATLLQLFTISMLYHVQKKREQAVNWTKE